jgi:DNA-binding response OmpR family regulator
MPGRILLVEDDESIREQTVILLRDEGYDTDEAPTAEAGLASFDRRPADCVLLDVMLPDLDGFEVCRRVRARSDVPIIMVTARSDSFDVVAGLEAGADDYVTKPFEPKELTARIRAMLRRAQGFDTGPKVLSLGDRVEVVPDEGVVRVEGSEVHLTRTEFRLLCEMAAAPGRVFTREVLLDSVWGYEYVGDTKLVDVHVYRLRTKIEANPAEPRHLLTVRGLGYKVVP